MDIANAIQPYQKIVERKASHYNAKKIKGGLCEMCGEKDAEDIHHLMHQKEADNEGFIDYFHKKSQS